MMASTVAPARCVIVAMRSVLPKWAPGLTPSTINVPSAAHVLDCGAAADFQSFFGVLHAELIAELLQLSKNLHFHFLL